MADKYNYLYSAGNGIEVKWLRLAYGHKKTWLPNHYLNLSHSWGKTVAVLFSSIVSGSGLVLVATSESSTKFLQQCLRIITAKH